MYSDSDRHKELGECDKLLTPAEPEHDFDCAEPRLQEVKDIVRKARASSAPGQMEYRTKCTRTAQRSCYGCGN
ncbi:hypothetical protein DPMN_001483 [Dreissena polymorpha]|uniref:Uncharacterized protein n=1 Tax=Dreissena polymorpha TaxID=45954 RepID=A0A9D4MII2_DREPO|nr:hypothetical protein DPMN_001483 [Dreissena polymorpha]